MATKMADLRDRQREALSKVDQMWTFFWGGVNLYAV